MRRGLRRFERRTVIVHTQPGPSLRGVLLAAHRDCLVLGNARHLDDEKDLGGEIVIPRSPGIWLQTVMPEPAP